MFLDTYERYLEFITDPQLRTHVRQLAEKRRSAPFSGNSGRHQTLVHINTLFRLGLVESSRPGQSRIYGAKYLPEGSRSLTSRLLSAVPNVRALEETVESQSLYDVVGRTLGIGLKTGSINDEEFINLVRRVYGPSLGHWYKSLSAEDGL